jgi:hypothetical protein
LPTSETEAYAGLLIPHLRAMTDSLRKLDADQWDWTPDVAAPTARILAAHAWQWLICDRRHIAEPDALKHLDIPDPPKDPQAMCDALSEETDRWEKMILGFTPEELDAPRSQFNSYPRTVRNFICHVIQNSIYKNGQFATLFFALGHDGTAPYAAPLPNPIYAELRADSR